VTVVALVANHPADVMDMPHVGRVVSGIVKKHPKVFFTVPVKYGEPSAAVEWLANRTDRSFAAFHGPNFEENCLRAILQGSAEQAVCIGGEVPELVQAANLWKVLTWNL